jgi:hypothetical protein
MIGLYYWPTPSEHKITIFLESACAVTDEGGRQQLFDQTSAAVIDLRNLR